MSEFLYPLPALYAAAGRELPTVETVNPAELSAGAHQLLVHSGDMTSKLEDYFDDAMLLRVLERQHTPEFYRREVLLYCAKSGLPVEYGAIEIVLDAFDDPLRSAIIEARLPLGGLLNTHGFRYRSEPHAFLRVAPCEHLAELFGLAKPEPLFGRSNRLLSADGVELARIVEILRPV
jgi:chorismate-pyruvate lyase